MSVMLIVSLADVLLSLGLGFSASDCAQLALMLVGVGVVHLFIKCIFGIIGFDEP
jgi:hypothetical protein